jgi:hypothetical protein
MADNNEINAFPTKELFISILVRDITIRDAIGDLLDNSVDGALRLRTDGNYEGLKVEIKLDATSRSFTISDNCGGIPVDVAREYAFCFGRPEGVTSTGHSVGVFGIGMKRALFRLGKRFRVDSIAMNSTFSMEVDVDKWKVSDKDGKPENWNFNFIEHKENISDNIPEQKRGTTITIYDIHDDVCESFSLNNEITTLIYELQHEHLFSIDQGLKVYVNNILLEAPELKLLSSELFKTAYWEKVDGPVHIKIYAGISESEKLGQNGGWYIFCNKRLVLGPDQTKVTGWGQKTGTTRIPEYHSQFYRFRGYVFLDAEDPITLPWNTAKTNLDLDSPVYRSVLQKMIYLMRSVIDFLNMLHDESGNFLNQKIRVTPLQNAIDEAITVPLKAFKESTNRTSIDRFTFPEPAKPESPIPSEVWIRYAVSKKKYDLVQEYFQKDRPGEIGFEIFNYFFEREIQD